MATPTRFTDHALRALATLPSHLRRIGRDRPPNWLAGLRGILGPEEDDAPYVIAASDTAGRTFAVAGDRVHRFRAGGPATVASGGAANGLYTVITASYSTATDRTTIAVAEGFPAPGAGATLAGRATHSVQELEAVLFDLRSGRTLAAAAGAQLDRIGAILGLARVAADDAVYRAELYIQALINVGKGTIEEIVSVGRFPAGVTRFELVETFPAAMVAYIFGTFLTADQRRRLRSTKAGGVRMLFGSAQAAVPFGWGGDGDAAGVMVAGSDDVQSGGFSEVWRIASKDATAWFIEGDADLFFGAGQSVRVVGQADLDGVYAVTLAVFNPVTVQTQLFTTPAPPAPPLTTAQLGAETSASTVNGHEAIGALVELLP